MKPSSTVHASAMQIFLKSKGAAHNVHLTLDTTNNQEAVFHVAVIKFHSTQFVYVKKTTFRSTVFASLALKVVHTTAKLHRASANAA